jgi:hypothetical protein
MSDATATATISGRVTAAAQPPAPDELLASFEPADVSSGELVTAARCYFHAARIITDGPRTRHAHARILRRHDITPETDAEYLLMGSDPVAAHFDGGRPNDGSTWGEWPFGQDQWKPARTALGNLILGRAYIDAEILRASVVTAAP